MLHGGNCITPTQQEAHERSRAFRGHIAERAANVILPIDLSYFVPNVPFGETKTAPKPPPIDLVLYCRGMWFYDLIWPVPRHVNSRIDEIINAVARHFGLSKIDIRSDRRIAGEVIPRQLAMFLCKELTTRSLAEIGRRIGGKDHTTVIHGIKQARRRIETNPAYAASCEAIKLDLVS